MATESQPPDTRLAAVGLRPCVACGCHASPDTRSVCERSVETCLPVRRGKIALVLALRCVDLYRRLRTATVGSELLRLL